MSKWRSPALRDSGSRRGASVAASRPIGTLTNSTHSQPAHSVSMPPSRTPTAPPEPTAAPQTPIALLRSEPSAKSTVTSDSAAGESSAAPRPWTARAATSQPALWASPPASDAAANRIRPATNRRRRPSRSAIDTTAEQQEAAEHEHVRVDDPRQVVRREPELRPDRRQRDVDDRRVEHDDELRGGEQRQRHPLVGAAGRHPEFLSRICITTILQ